MKLLKGRGEESDVTYFNHPFDENNTMRLIDDEHLDKSVSVESLASDLLPDFEAIKEAERINAQKRKEKKSDEDESSVFNINSFFAS